MKKANEYVAATSALVWSVEDLHWNAECLNDSGIINEEGKKAILEMSNEDKLLWLNQILEDCNDEFCQVINERIGDAIYDYYRSTPMGKEEVGHIKYNR